jgi:serine/threonine-protein kinase
MVPDVPRPPKRPQLDDLTDDGDERDTPALAAYRVELPDRSVEGPFHYHQLAELFATGVASSACRISKDGGEMAPAKQFPELLRLVTSVEPWGTEAAWLAIDRRPIDRRTLPAWLFRLATLRETGAILVKDSARQRRKRVFLVDGAPEFSLPNDRGELLGEYLIAKAGVLRVEVEMAMSILPRFGGRLGDALVGLGVVRPVDLVRAIQEQTIERYLELLRWRHGEIAFERGATSGEERYPLGATVDLTLRGVRESYAGGEVREWLKDLGGALLSRSRSPLLRAEALRWTEGEARVLLSLGEPEPLASFLAKVTSRADVAADEASLAVFLGLTTGVLTTPGFLGPDDFKQP